MSSMKIRPWPPAAGGPRRTCYDIVRIDGAAGSGFFLLAADRRQNEAKGETR